MNKFFIILLLAVILVPSMIGYVSKAKEAQSSYEDYNPAADEYSDYLFN